MAVPIVAVSSRSVDQEFAQKIADANQLPFVVAIHPDEIREITEENPQALLFWDADIKGNETTYTPQSIRGIVGALVQSTKPHKVFAITDRPLNECKHLNNDQCFGHHMIRQYRTPAPALFSRLIAAVLIPRPFGMERYMPQGSDVKSIVLKESGQRRVAVQAVENVLQKNGNPERLSVQIAGAVDELLMNAIFDAPVDKDGYPFRKELDRSEDFPFSSNRCVELMISYSDEYYGIGVSDPFGTLKKETILGFVRQNFKKDEFSSSDQGASGGLGLNGIIQSGLSLVFISHPGVRTDVMIFFPKVKTYKEFKSGFRFLSLLSE